MPQQTKKQKKTKPKHNQNPKGYIHHIQWLVNLKTANQQETEKARK